MAMIEKKDDAQTKLVSKDQYTTALFDTTDDAAKAKLFKMIREHYKVEPALGEIMLVSGKPYFTASGCSRLAESKQTKDIRFEYLDPSTFPIFQIKQKPENFIIVRCLLTKADGGVVEGLRALDLALEKDKKPKHWSLKDFMGFTETKAFMRAVGKAYNVDIFDDLPDDMRNKAEDVIISNKKKAIPVEHETKPVEKKVQLPPHADGMPAMPPKMDHPKVETKIIPAESSDLKTAKEKAIAEFEANQKQIDKAVETAAIDQSAEDMPENPFEDDMGESDLKQLADDKSSESPKMVMTVDELIANAGHTTVKSKAGKDVDAITFIFKEGSMFDLGDNGKSWKIIGPNGKSVFVAKSITDYNPDLKVLAVPVWCMTMKAEDKAKWQEILEAKN